MWLIHMLKTAAIDLFFFYLKSTTGAAPRTVAAVFCTPAAGFTTAGPLSLRKRLLMNHFRLVSAT